MRLKPCLLGLAALHLCACSQMNVRYEARVQKNIATAQVCEVPQTEFFEFQYDETIPVPGTMVGCILTFWLYGGWCWAYLSLPHDSDILQTRNAAYSKLRTIYNLTQDYDLNKCIQFEQIDRISW